MAPTLERAFFHLLILVAFLSFLLVIPSSCFHPRTLFNASYSAFGSDWSPAVATWYGPSNGDGSEGGACGYGSIVGQPPFSSMVSSAGPSLFNWGKGCGACYEVKCTGNSACSGKPVRVTITDECPGCGSDKTVHFDMSGSAFSAMAASNQAGKLRNAGIIQIQYRRVRCYYPGTNIAFHVDSGSNPNYFATVIEYVDGDGDLAKVELKEAYSVSWLSMQQRWGAVWGLNSGSALRAPFSIRLTAFESGRTVLAYNVIPAWWKPGLTYRSLVNFQS